MKVNLLSKLLSKLLGDMSVLSELGRALNRNLDNASLYDITSSLQNEINDNLVALVSGKTTRIQALRDMAKLEPTFNQVIDTDLKYCFPLGVSLPSYDELRILKLELLALVALTDNTVSPALRKQIANGIYPFEAVDTCDLMVRLGEPEYIRLECQAVIKTGYVSVSHLHCPSENMDIHLTAERRKYDVTFAKTRLFNDHLGKLYEEYYPESDLDLGSFRSTFNDLVMTDRQAHEHRKFNVFLGCQKNADVCVKRTYEIRVFASPESKDGLPEAVLIQQGAIPYDNTIISGNEVLAYMAAVVALQSPGEANFWVHYDALEKNVSIQVGDPNDPTVDPVE